MHCSNNKIKLTKYFLQFGWCRYFTVMNYFFRELILFLANFVFRVLKCCKVNFRPREIPSGRSTKILIMAIKNTSRIAG